MSSNQKQQPSVVSQSQSRYVQPPYLQQRPSTPQRADGYHVGTPPAYVQQQPNQVNNQVQPLRGMPPTGPPTQASTPPNSDLKVQTMPQQQMNIAYVPQGQLRAPGQAGYYRPTPPTNQNRMANQRQGQQAIYPQQSHQFVSMSIPHTPVYINAPAVPYYNNTPRPTTNFVSSSYQVIAGQHLSGYASYAAQPPTQPQPQYYYNAAMMPRPPQQVAPAPQNAAQPPPTANIPIPQPLPQHATHTKHKRRSNAIPIIDPNTGRDRLSEMYEQEQDSSHPPSGESSARQTPQPPIPNKELQATFAKQVAQAINEDEVSVVEELDQPPILEHVQIYPLPPQAVHPRLDIVQASILKPATKEFVPASLAKEVTPVVSAITDAVEVTITNKSSKDRESPAKSRKQREQHVVSRDTKEQVKDALPISKDSSISVNSNKEEIKQKDVVVNVPTNKDITGNSQRDESKKSIKKDKVETKTSISVNPAEEDVADSTPVIQSSIPDLYYQSKSKTNASQKTKEVSPKQNVQSTSVVTPTPATAQKPIQSSGNVSVPVKQQQVDKAPSKSNKSSVLNSKDVPKETTDIDAFNDNIVIDNSTTVAPTSNIANNTNHSNDNSISTMEFVNNTNNIMLNNNIELTATETPEESQEILAPKPIETKPIVKKIDVTDIVVEMPKAIIDVTTAPFNNIAATSVTKVTEPKVDTDIVHNTENDMELETADATETPVITETKLDLPYSTSQWTPWKKDGLKVYAREFLLAMSKYQASLKKPDNLPGDILKMDQGRVGDISRFSMGNRSTDFAPNFGNNSYQNKSSSQRGAIGKRNSSQKGPLGSNGKAGGPNNNKPPVRYTVSLKNDIKLNEADNAWKPARFAASGELSEDEKKTAELYKKFRGILNKLTPQKFEKLMTQVQDLNIDTSERLQGIIDLVFEKAVDEPKFGSAYSSLCRELAMMQVPLNSGEGPEEFVNFRKLLVTRCQVEFEKSNANEKLKTSKVYEIENCADPDKRKELTTELEENERQLRRKSVGTIRFIGELFKQQMLTVSIMLRCLKELLQAKDEESLECLCKLLATVGEILDNTKQTDLNMIFNEMRDIVEKRLTGISSRIRFMLQDSIELRLSSWVPRRLDSAPKKMDQIEKEVDNEQMMSSMQANSTPMSSRKDDRGQNNKNNPGSGRKYGGNVNSEDGWTTPHSRSKFSVQSDKLKSKAPPSTEPLGSQQTFSSWSMGSKPVNKGGPAAPAPGPVLANVNAFNVLNTIGEYDSKHPPSMNMRNNKGYNSKGSSLERGYNRPPYDDVRNAKSGSQHRSRDNASSSYQHQRNTPQPSKMPTDYPKRQIPYVSKSVAFAEPTGAESVPSQQSIPEPTLAKAAEISPENVTLDLNHYEKTFKKALETYTISCSLVECEKQIKTIPPSLLPQLIEDALLSVLDRSKNARLKSGKLYSILISNGTVLRKDFCERLKSVIAEAKDLMIDIPTIWEFLAEIVAPLVLENCITLNELSTLLDEESKNKFGSKFLAAIFRTIITENDDEKEHAVIGPLLRDSNTKLSNYMPESQIDQFIEHNKFHFLNAPQPRISVDLLKKLLKMFADNTSFEDVMKWISQNVGDEAVKENQFIRTLATAIFDYSIVNEKLKAEILAEKYCYFLRYVDNNPNLELQCLFALQSLINKLEHPQGILLNICNKLYEDTVFSLESFLAWETNNDPLEQEGKGVTLKQLTAFFVDLKDNEYSSASEDA